MIFFSLVSIIIIIAICYLALTSSYVCFVSFNGSKLSKFAVYSAAVSRIFFANGGMSKRFLIVKICEKCNLIALYSFIFHYHENVVVMEQLQNTSSSSNMLR